MSKEVYKKLIKEFLALGNKNNWIVFHGGEPLLYPQLIEEICKYSKKSCSKGQKVFFRLQTNGSILNEKIISLLKKEKIGVGVSVDVSNKNFYRRDSLGRNYFSEISKNLILLKKNKINHSIIAVLTDVTNVSPREIISLLKEWGVNTIKFNLLLTKGSNNAKRACKKNYNIVKSFAEAIISNNKSNKFKIYETNLSYLLKNMIYPNYCYMCASSPCGAGTCVISCNPNGDIYPCDEVYDLTRFRLGNILSNSLNKILSSKNRLILRKRNVESIIMCKKCPFQFICCGGCPSKLLILSKNLNNPSPYCEYYKNIISFLINLVDKGDFKYLVNEEKL